MTAIDGERLVARLERLARIGRTASGGTTREAYGTLDVEGALVLDAIDDLSALEEAHAAGTPVVVRAADAAAVKTALARPEVSCVLVEDPSLLELDLPELTYG